MDGVRKLLVAHVKMAGRDWIVVFQSVLTDVLIYTDSVILLVNVFVNMVVVTKERIVLSVLL